MPNTGYFPQVSNALDFVQRTIAPNPKCNGCLHYETRATACLVALTPTECGEGSEPHAGYAPISQLKPASPHQPPQSSAQANAGPNGASDTANNQGLENMPMQILGDEAPQLAAVLQSVAQVAVSKSQSSCIACQRGPSTGRVSPSLASYMSTPHSCTYQVTEPMVKAVLDGVAPRIRRKLTTDSVEEFLEAAMEDISKGHVGFSKLTAKLAKKPGIKNPKAVAAAIGNKKYGEKKMHGAAERGKPLKDKQKIKKDWYGGGGQSQPRSTPQQQANVDNAQRAAGQRAAQEAMASHQQRQARQPTQLAQKARTKTTDMPMGGAPAAPPPPQQPGGKRILPGEQAKFSMKKKSDNGLGAFAPFFAKGVDVLTGPKDRRPRNTPPMKPRPSHPKKQHVTAFKGK